MLTRCIRAEKLKLRHSLIFPACILIPIIPAVMGTFNYMQNLGILNPVVLSLDAAYTVLCQLLLCAADRSVLFLYLETGTPA